MLVQSLASMTQSAVLSAVEKINGSQGTYEDMLSPTEQTHLTCLVSTETGKASAYLGQHDSVKCRRWILVELLPFRDEMQGVEAQLDAIRDTKEA